MAKGRNAKNPYKGPDRFTVAAKKQGYPARSVFKLEEIDRRIELLKGGMRVLDLGRDARAAGCSTRRRRSDGAAGCSPSI